MKVRIKFTKTGAMKFVGHLDTMRYFQKAIRRAELPVAFSGGYSPHMIMSFAAPLGVGTTSMGEYFDMELTEKVPTAEIEDRLNAVMVEGITISSARQVEDGKASTAMALVAAADYFVAFRPGKEPCGNWQEKLADFLAQKEITVTKKTKRSEKTVDIRPFIYQMEACDSGVDVYKRQILIIDNYDSFSYNLYQMIGETGTDLKVIRNDEMTVEEIRQLMPECIILSPGPGRPEDAGVLIDVIKTMGKRAPILGVCLGHQAICADVYKRQDELAEKEEIPTDFGETLSWKYFCYVREHPISWEIPTEILYGENDSMTTLQTVKKFMDSHEAHLTVMKGGEHWFHTKEQLAFLNDWMRSVV